MFEYAFVEARGRSVRPGTFVASMAGELGLIGLGVLLPLLFVDALPQAGWILQHVPLIGPPPRAASEAPLAPAAAARPPRPTPAAAKLFEPVKYPAKAQLLVDSDPGPAGPGSGDRAGVPGGTGDPQGPLHPGIADAMRIPVPAPPPPHVETPAVTAPASTPLLRVGGKVGPPAPVATPSPQYPALARQARVSGTVCLEAIIATDGTVRSVRLVQGHVLLTRAAIEAVRTWRYTPPTLNGDPIEVLMYVEVNFVLNR